MAGFSGWSITRGAQRLPVPHRKLIVVIAAIVLGGGIWSMHFVAMLGLQLPIAYLYDELMTLLSALIAILMVRLALLILRFTPRTRTTATVAAASAMGLSVLAIWVAYGARTKGNTLLGTACFAVSVCAVHFIAMAGTGFIEQPSSMAAGPDISNEIMAMGGTVAAFVISGTFMLTGVSFVTPVAGKAREMAVNTAPPPEKTPQDPPEIVPVPYEKQGRTQFLDRTAIAAMRAEGIAR